VIFADDVLEREIRRRGLRRRGGARERFADPADHEITQVTLLGVDADGDRDAGTGVEAETLTLAVRGSGDAAEAVPPARRPEPESRGQRFRERAADDGHELDGRTLQQAHRRDRKSTP